MKILYVVHATPWAEQSGTPLIAAQYALAAKNSGHEVGMLVPSVPLSLAPAPDQSPFSAIRILHCKDLVPASLWSSEAFSMPDITEEVQLNHDLISFNPDLIHIVDWVGIDPSIFFTLKRLGAPIIRHIWNFEDICHFIEPIYNNETIPCSPPLSPSKCGQCIAKQHIVKIPQSEWTIDNLKSQIDDLFLRKCSEFENRTIKRTQMLDKHFSETYSQLVFPTQSFKNYWDAFYNVSTDSIVVEHGVDFIEKPQKKKIGNDVNCVYVGGDNIRKGWDVVQKIFLSLKEKGIHNIKLKVYGNGFVSEDIKGLLRENHLVEFCGVYKREDLLEIFSWANVGLLPTRFETYCRAVREMMWSGVVPIASSAFGIPEAVENGVNGFLVEPNSVDVYVQKLIELTKDKKYHQDLSDKAYHTCFPTMQDEYEKLETLYKKVFFHKIH